MENFVELLIEWYLAPVINPIHIKALSLPFPMGRIIQLSEMAKNIEQTVNDITFSMLSYSSTKLKQNNVTLTRQLNEKCSTRSYSLFVTDNTYSFWQSVTGYG